MILYSYVEQVMTMRRVHKMTTLAFILSELLSLIVSGVISCPLQNLNTLLYIIMILHSYVEQVMTICRMWE